ncbi:tryptophan halogenase family protein [Marinimicrobium agarilyticum]|uniref:tryptophan halogenase family protein n=1 Tax=Marinimicrobium agarilyticum TaxID=306546 RepID=UPI0005608662|nr:tryptophan halogenase family protein [Marinimicrobium agarilyticum]
MNTANRTHHWIIVGGGTAGWMAAAAFSAKLDASEHRITLIESDAIGTVGVGEATVPHLRYFNQVLGIDERDFMRETQATYKLGIEFVDWGHVGDRYLHPFGVYGEPAHQVGFFQSWLKARSLGDKAPLEAYAPGAVMARHERFAYPGSSAHPFSRKYSYAFHIDASRYARFLRRYAEARGVVRIEGKVSDVQRSSVTGDIQQLTLDSGERLWGDGFIDCSGFRAVLHGQTLGVGFENWSQWLPCDRAVAIPSASQSAPRPYTRAIAHAAGWRWQIPLQHRTGNGVVYCSEHMSADQATRKLLESMDGEPLAEPNHLQFTTGVRSKSWSHNSVAIGLSAGFLEPLESTSIYLIQSAIMNFLECLPRGEENAVEALRNEFNRRMALEYERVRDFLILHYTLTTRDDSAFWHRMRTLERPHSLERKIALFREQGQVEHYELGMFLEPSWLAVYEGQGLLPERWHPAADRAAEGALLASLRRFREETARWVDTLPGHDHCLTQLGMEADEAPWPPAAMSLYGVFS